MSQNHFFWDPNLSALCGVPEDVPSVPACSCAAASRVSLDDLRAVRRSLQLSNTSLHSSFSGWSVAHFFCRQAHNLQKDYEGETAIQTGPQQERSGACSSVRSAAFVPQKGSLTDVTIFRKGRDQDLWKRKSSKSIEASVC
ncbi:hypothetical protein KP509_18G085600 [Ceratopteris richardii]|uniref:Uncharacterized protein n=1 Tax=Ceratopteris richardii TaxID=49495 RepID=A0A8T2ST21_CERRI|nr:hypothetical protein KP509_18G085600 [Ceratopteris richardii]